MTTTIINNLSTVLVRTVMETMTEKTVSMALVTKMQLVTVSKLTGKNSALK
jgi:hypothetical protein